MSSSVALGDVATIVMGQSPSGDTYNNEEQGLPLLNGPTEFGTPSPKCTLFTTDSKRECEPGDLLFCVRGSTTGRMNWADIKYSLGRGVCGIRGDSQLETWFIRFSIENRLEALLKHAGGGTFPNLRQSDLRGFRISWPKNRNQIASILKAYDDLIVCCQNRISILEEMARSLYREWFVHFRFPGHEECEFVESELGQIPSGWKVKKVQDCFEITGGGTPSRKVPEYWEGGDIKWFAPRDLTAKKSMFMDDSSDHITSVGLAKSSAKLFPKRSVMLTSRATIGAVSINTDQASTNQGFITCIPNDGVPLYWLYHWITENVPVFERLASGSTFKEISKGVFRKIPIVLPARNHVAAFESLCQPIGDQMLNLQRQIENLRETRDLLLPRLMSGQVILDEV